MLRRCAATLQNASAMVKSFRLSDLTAQVSTTDVIFARKLPSGGCQFFAWPGTEHHIAVKGILSMPPHLQTVHALFGRRDVPVDICADIDCPVPKELQSVSSIESYQKKILREHVNALKAAVTAEGESIEKQVCLQSPNLKKVSYHIHMRLKDAAFTDYESLLGFLQAVKSKGSIPHADLQIYRPNGMLRMHKSKKENLQSAMCIVQDPEYHYGVSARLPTDEEAALLSLCVRTPKTYSRLIHKALIMGEKPRDGGNSGAGSAVSQGGAGSELKYTAIAPRTKTEACETAMMWMSEIPADLVKDWKNWITLGLAAFRVAHYFRDATVPSFKRPVMDEFLAAWVEVSKRVPEKFVPGDCEKSWATFAPEARSDSWWLSYQTICKFANGISPGRRVK